MVNRDPRSNLLADNPDPATKDLVDKYQTPSPADPNATAAPPATPPGPNGEPPPVGVAPGPVRPGDPATAVDGTLVTPGTGLAKPPVDKAATWKCATMGMGCDSAGVDFSIIDLEPAHQTLDTASFVPGANVPASAVNTTMYLGEGKYADALIAAAAIPPGGKWLTAGGKVAAKSVRKGYEWFKETGVYKKVGDVLGLSKALPSGVKDGWQSRPARGDGTIWQKPGSTNDTNNSMRIMNPGYDARYPHGYVRFYNERGQSLDLNGKPTSRAETHIPRRADGSYDIPKGW